VRAGTAPADALAGAPIANAISFNLISAASLAYGVFFVPHTAWHPLSMRAFDELGVLVRLGLSGVGEHSRLARRGAGMLMGVGQLASEWWSWELVGCESVRTCGCTRLTSCEIQWQQASSCGCS
jgi:hypothetical protein